MSKNIVFALVVGGFALLTTLLLQHAIYFLFNLEEFVRYSYVVNLMNFIQVVVLCVSVVLFLRLTKTNKFIDSLILSSIVFVTFFIIESLVLLWPYFPSNLASGAGELLFIRIFGIGIWFLLLALFLGAFYSLIFNTKLFLQFLSMLIIILSISTVFNSYHNWIFSSRFTDIDTSKSLFLQHVKFVVGKYFN